MRWRAEKRRGIVAVLVAVSLVTILGVAAIALDGGLLLDNRRSVQAAADAAALAAAIDHYTKWSTNQGVDKSGTASASALSVAESNGYANDGTTSVVTVNLPPNNYLDGPNKGKALPAGFAEVIVQYNQKRGFSSIFGSGALPVKARAVARGVMSKGQNSILVLNTTTKNAFSVTASATNVTVGGSIIVNSNDPAAMTGSGSGYVRAPEYDVTGGYTGAATFEDLSGNQLTPKTGQTATPDPLSTLPYPDPSSLTLQNSGTRIVQATEPQPVTLDPGVYGGISIHSGATAVLNPGIYYMKGSGFAVSAANVTANGVLIFNGPTTVGGTTNKTVTITGGSTFTMSPMNTGTWAGITIFQERNSTPTMNITSGSAMDVSGTVYAAKSTVKVTGNSLANTQVSIGSQFICDIFNIAGGTFKISSSGGGQSRQIGLVE